MYTMLLELNRICMWYQTYSSSYILDIRGMLMIYPTILSTTSSNRLVHACMNANELLINTHHLMTRHYTSLKDSSLDNKSSNILSFTHR